jgi:hypothetical protein
MKKDLSRKIYGIVVVLIGILLILSSLGFNIQIDGWWTMFIIVPCLVSLIVNGYKVFSLLGLLVGFWLLAKEQGLVNDGMADKLFFPVIVLIFGGWLLFGRSKNNDCSGKCDSDANDNPEYLAVFSGNEIKNISKDLKGMKSVAVFGGLEIDMTNTKIKKDMSIDVVAIFGGIEIKAPKDVRVVVKGVPVFGGCSNTTKNIDDDKVPTITVNAVAIFGGIEIK